MSNINYCPLVWHHCGIGNSRKIEKIQERALRFVFNDFTSPYDVLLQRSNGSMNYVCRIRTMLMQVHKSINSLGPHLLHELFNIKETKYNFREPFKIILPKVKTTSHGIQSLRYQGAKIYNSLPAFCKTYDFNDFTCFLKKWCPECSCGSCLLCLH